MKLNQEVQCYKPFPEEGTDRITTQMPLLIKEGRYPISTAELMEKRVEASSSSDEEFKRSCFNSFFH